MPGAARRAVVSGRQLVRAEDADEVDPAAAAVHVMSRGSSSNGYHELVALVQGASAGVVHATISEELETTWFPVGTTPLHYVCGLQQGHGEYAELLVARGADVHARTDRGWTPLYYAAITGCVRSARAVLGSGVKLRDIHGRSVLWWATCVGHENMVALLVEAGAGMADEAEDGEIALWEAASMGHLGILRLLMDAGLEGCAVLDGTSVLEVAMLCDDEEVAQWLRVRLGDAIV